MTIALRPQRGGFLRAFGCGWFIREFLLGKGPFGAPLIDSARGAPQADIFFHYKTALIRTTAEDKAVRTEEKLACREGRSINPDNIQALAEKYITHSPYKAHGCRYHSFVTYFSMLQKLGWVEPTGEEEKSEFQEHYSAGQPRRYFRLTAAGKAAGEVAWSNPHAFLYRPELG